METFGLTANEQGEQISLLKILLDIKHSVCLVMCKIQILQTVDLTECVNRQYFLICRVQLNLCLKLLCVVCSVDN